MTESQLAEKLTKYGQAARRGADWLLDHQSEDGSIGPVREYIEYYRVPEAFALVGERVAAVRVLDWIRRNMLTPQGALEGVSPLGWSEHAYGSYPIGCLINGASLLGEVDVVACGLQDLLQWQDGSGGFYRSRKDRSAEAELELCPTAQAGMTLLQVGQIEPARAAGRWLKQLWDAQPDIEQQLFTVMRCNGELVGGPFDNEADAVYYATRKDDPWQHHFNPGIAAACLAQLYRVTGESEWLDAARNFQEFSMTTDPCQFRSMQVCKSGWGSGMLYVATQETQYRDWTVRLGDWFVENQQEAGYWKGTAHWTPEPTLANLIEATAEFVGHTARIESFLSV